jgi:hypothetical protein
LEETGGNPYPAIDQNPWFFGRNTYFSGVFHAWRFCENSVSPSKGPTMATVRARKRANGTIRCTAMLLLQPDFPPPDNLEKS